ncbi:hypothetical protein CDAR_307371 [Caerostris darwini]|uniref:Cytochrome c biogenesis B n=1 Tax=Caerostris darwini TaxID=1538125 RepID=A0AAV4T287_9ARAC|nr:hypothetical protein CDAR_307371 [Caerostris darwini]
MIPLHSGGFAIHYPFHSSSAQFSLEELVPNWVSLHVQLGLVVSFYPPPSFSSGGCPLQDKRNTIIKVPQATGMIPLHSGGFAIHYPFHSSSVQFSLEELVPNWISLHVQLGLGVSFWATLPFLQGVGNTGDGVRPHTFLMTAKSVILQHSQRIRCNRVVE